MSNCNILIAINIKECHKWQLLSESALRKTFFEFDNMSDLKRDWNSFSLQMDVRDALTATSQCFKKDFSQGNQ